METPQPHNPVTQRLDRMVELWWQFESETSKPIGRWLLQPDERRMLEAFLRREESEGGQIPSVFWELRAPFESPHTYPQSLLAEMVDTCLELGNLEDLLTAGFTEDFFQGYQNRREASGWLEFLEAFSQQMQPMAGHMVVWLQPQSVQEEDAFQQWLMELLEKGCPESVRLMLMDAQAPPRYEQLVYYFRDQVHDLEPELDMAAALAEIAAQTQAQNPDDPGGQYQAAFVALMQQSQGGDLDQARHHAEKARDIAQKQQWTHLEVAVYLALAAAEVNHQAFDEAYAHYAQAIERAEHLAQKDASLGQRLGMQAYLGEGGARLVDQDFAVAMNCYQAAADLAGQLKDYVMATEAWRMVGYCATLEKRWIESWEAYEKGLESAQALPPKEVANTTLAYLGHAMLDIASQAGQSHHDKVRVMDAIDKLLGADWQDQPLTSTS